MDWSLALISQGIASTIDCSEDGWGLIVNSEEHALAIRTIEQYRAENRSWPWRQRVREEVLFDWGSLAWVLLVCVFYWIDTTRLSLRDAGLMDAAAVSSGQWWRLFTAVFLHGDLAHLATNVSLGLLLLGLTMGRYGTGIGLLAAHLAGVGGNITTWLVFREHLSLGASGMVMGCLGMLAAESVHLGRPNALRLKPVLTAAAGGVLLFVLVGLNPESDVLAHLGGFAAGLLLGLVLSPLRALTDSAVANLLAGLLFALGVILAWWAALTHAFG